MKRSRPSKRKKWYRPFHGVEQNYSLAAQWYQKAAEQLLPLSTGVNEARYHLAILYIQGRGVPRNYSQAYFWLRLVGLKDYASKASEHMTTAEIDEVERLVKQWKSEHGLKPEVARLRSLLTENAHPVKR